MKKIAITIITFISIVYSASNKPYITKLTLSLPKKEINRDTTIEAKVTATYSNNTTKEINKNIEWVVSKKDALKIKNLKLTALKDYPTTITVEARVKNSLNKIVISNKESLKIYWEVNGHRLPPEPDPKVNNATLLGVDINKNGVRDDVERWIYETYKDKHPIYIDIAMQEARADRLILLKQPKTKKEAMEIKNEVDKPVYCQLYYKLFAKYYNESILVKEDITDEYFRRKIYFNTKERMAVYERYDILLSGDSYALPSDKEMKAACDFDTSKYDKE